MSRRIISFVSIIVVLGLAANVRAGAGPVGWWKFDEGTGSTANDSSGNSFTGSIEEEYTWIPGNVGPWALDFTYGYVTVPDNALLRPSRLTMSLWVNLPTSQPEYARLIVKGNDNSETYNFQFMGYVLHFGMNTSEGGYGVNLANPLWPDEWIHIGATYDGNSMNLYVNSELDNKVTTGAFTPLQSGGPLSIAARAPDYDRRMSGSLDDVRIYNYGMTATEVRQLYWEVRDPNVAEQPYPADEATDVDPDVTLCWVPGASVLSHDVYMGTGFDDVDTATTDSHPNVSYANVDVNNYNPPGTLDLGASIYWRVDEVTGSGANKGPVWSFTVADGKAHTPTPVDGDICLPTSQTLNWTAGALAVSHDVYFGTDFDLVNDAFDPHTLPGRGNQSGTTYNPGSIDGARTYYWRIDEVGDTTFVKGDVWSFSTEGGLCLKVDLAHVNCPDMNLVRPETAKPGWWHWTATRWADLYMHDLVWENGGSSKPKVCGLTMRALNGGGCPLPGTPRYDPICNTWFQEVDWPEQQNGAIELALHDLPPGEYALVSYHNHFGCYRTDSPYGTGVACDCHCNVIPPMPRIKAMSVRDIRDLPYQLTDSFQKLFPGVNWTTGPFYEGVVSIQDACNVPAQQVTSDDDLIPSVIRFETDGSPVCILYNAGCCQPDPVRPTRVGGRAILNAFKLQLLTVPDRAYMPTPEDGAEDVLPDVMLTWNAVPGTASHDVYLGTDAEDVNNATTAVQLGVYKGRQDPCQYDPALQLDVTYYWRIDEVNDLGGTTKGNLWSFTTHDGKASNPSPASGSENIALDVLLSWQAGPMAASHDVYFGTDYEAVRDADTTSDHYKGSQSLETTTYSPTGLVLGETYYWRIDEVNPGYADSKGDLWSFATLNYIPLDDFESYCPDFGCGNEIYDTWRDGWENGTSSTIALGDVAFDPVHGGSQSMVYAYYNQFDPYYSEVDRDVGEPSNWAGLGLKAIVLYFYGSAGNSLERLYLGLEDSTGSASYSEAA